MMLLKSLMFLLKWVIIVLISVEFISFIVILASNYIIYGVAREGSRAVYDPYTVFLQKPAIRPTLGSVTSNDPSGDFVIWVFGGSTIRGDTDHDDKTIPSYLARKLNSEHDKVSFQVVNFGTNSFNSLLEVKYLQKALIEMRPTPNLVIFYDGANDIKYLLEHRSLNGHHGYRRLKALIESYHLSFFGIFKPLKAAVLSSFTKELYDKINQVFIPIESDPGLVEEFAQSVEKRYDYVNRIVECFGGRFLLIYQPMLWTDNCTVPKAIADMEQSLIVDSKKFNTIRRNFTIPYQVILDQLKNKSYFVSFRDALCDRTQPAYRPDGVHLTDYGRKLVAGKIRHAISSFLGKTP